MKTNLNAPLGFSLSDRIMTKKEEALAKNNVCPRCLMPLEFVGPVEKAECKICTECKNIWIV